MFKTAKSCALLDKTELGQEIGSTRDHKDGIADLAVSIALNKAGTCGDDCIKLHDLTDVMVGVALSKVVCAMNKQCDQNLGHGSHCKSGGGARSTQFT